ncbi:MAG: glycosyltransferase family 2 protein [Gammaproteobacteria bacterium]|nr:glycosyltransferase family 2 protein [Gammaproteobacteria bacterium]
MSDNFPLVSVITPVYNGVRYLSECIESVLNQTYQNWEYTLVDNCSTDGTAELIKRYAARDARIRVVTNERTVDVIQNHNIAFQHVSAKAGYCKLLQADDWMFPECLDLMVNAGEAAPSSGIVGSYCLAGTKVRCVGLPYPTPVVSGRELGRMTLLGMLYLFWSPSCLLIRADLVRGRQPFYRSGYLHADVEALYDVLQVCDFAFVHQVLTYIRTHEGSMTAQDAKRANTQRLSRLRLLHDFGPVYLDSGEFTHRLEALTGEYYENLALCVFERKAPEFWRHQKAELQKLGYPLSHLRLVRETASALLTNPREIARRLRNAASASR